MQLTYVKILNYRNLGNLELSINRDINFIVGENNIGKSNFLKCLSNIFLCKQFSKEDFLEETLPIKVTFRLCLNYEEIGLFDDLTDPDDESGIEIIAEQSTPDDYIQYFHSQTRETIKKTLIKRINVITYDSLRNPKSEIDFSKTKGAGAFLNYLVSNYVRKNPKVGFYKKNELKKVKKSISEALSGISAFDRFNIQPSVEENNAELLSKIVSLKDGNGVNVQSDGYGVQFNLLIILALLEKIMDFCKSKSEGETSFSSLIILDEPEIHLHPYLQRTLIADIQRLSKGQDEKFNELLSKQFGITEIKAQIIITTHSPNILFVDYYKIIRMYRHDGKTMAVSCSNLQLSESEKKQLYAQFMYVKEAVFSKAAIIVEGESEYSSFGLFAKKMGIDFDREGIALIKAGGADSVKPIMAMLDKLGISSVGVIDKDKKIEKNLPTQENLFYTTTMCFDSEIVRYLIKSRKRTVLEKIITDTNPNGLTKKFQKNNLQKKANKFNFKGLVIDRDIAINECTVYTKMYEFLCVTFFANEKGILFGRTIAENIEYADIPPCYKRAVKKVRDYARAN